MDGDLQHDEAVLPRMLAGLRDGGADIAIGSRYVAGDAFASTLLIVSGFTLPQFKIEVEVTAARSADLPQGRASG